MAVTSGSVALPSNIPGPQPFPILGRTAQAVRFARDSVGYADRLFQSYGPVVSLAAGGGTNIYSSVSPCPGTVLAYGPEIVRQVTTQHQVYHKHPLSGRLYRKKGDSQRTEPLKHFGVGLFGVNEQQHQQHRQLMMPALHGKQIVSYRDDMVEIARSVFDRMPLGQSCDITATMRLLTLRVATKTLFGYDLNEKGGELGQLLQDTFNPIGSFGVTLLPLDIPGFAFHRILNKMARLDNEMRSLIARKRSSGGDGTDVLSMLISARDAETGMTLSEDELLGHVGVLFAAGHETSANALSWTLFLLSQHPEVTADLHNELESVLQGDAPTVEQLQRLPLLERVVKESLRILPPVPWNGRITSKPTQLSGYPLPQGTEVFVSIYKTHHDSEHYPEPEKFDPKRWESISPSSYEYNPFSAGPRTCIGASFAMMEIKIVLAMLLQRYRLQCPSQLEVNRGRSAIVMGPRDGLPMFVHPQDRNFQQSVGSIRGNVREMVALPE